MLANSIVDVITGPGDMKDVVILHWPEQAEAIPFRFAST
jgi:hypothetical protein